MGTALNPYVALGNMGILTVLILPIHEHGRLIHFMCLFQSLLKMPCSFQHIGPSHPLLSLSLGILFNC